MTSQNEIEVRLLPTSTIGMSPEDTKAYNQADIVVKPYGTRYRVIKDDNGSTCGRLLTLIELNELKTKFFVHCIKKIKSTKPRGFAAMNKEKQAEIASKGGKAAHAIGRAFQFEKGSAIAIEAGKKGGRATAEKLTKEQYSEMGQKGGQARWKNKMRNGEGT